MIKLAQREGRKQNAQTHRKLHFQLFERPLPTVDDGFPQLITARDVGVGEGVAEDHTQLSELWAFDDTNRLKPREHEEEYDIMRTHLIIRNDKTNKAF